MPSEKWHARTEIDRATKIDLEAPFFEVADFVVFGDPIEPTCAPAALARPSCWNRPGISMGLIRTEASRGAQSRFRSPIDSECLARHRRYAAQRGDHGRPAGEAEQLGSLARAPHRQPMGGAFHQFVSQLNARPGQLARNVGQNLVAE